MRNDKKASPKGRSLDGYLAPKAGNCETGSFQGEDLLQLVTYQVHRAAIIARCPKAGTNDSGWWELILGNSSCYVLIEYVSSFRAVGQ
ncbi:hypothetical protein Tco_0743715 [Tanacetum coccineum]